MQQTSLVANAEDNSLTLDYSAMNPFELAARHDIAKSKGHMIACAKIEAVVNKLKGRDRWFIDRLKYYRPVGAKEITLFN